MKICLSWQALDDEATEEREKYFWKSVQDLDIEVARTEGELIYCYALIIARKAIKKEIDIDYAFSRMLKIVYASDFDYRYLPFFEINFIKSRSGLPSPGKALI